MTHGYVSDKDALIKHLRAHALIAPFFPSPTSAARPNPSRHLRAHALIAPFFPSHGRAHSLSS
jgi:hypothetical protein